MRTLCGGLLLSLLLPALSAHAEEPAPRPKPMDYAQGVALTPEPGLAVQTLLVPLAVYRAARADLSDLSVFDGEGRPVPWALRTVTKLSERKRHEDVLPFFPIYGQRSARASLLALEVERSADGAVIAVRTPQAAQEAASQQLLAYIVHTGAPAEDLTALRFELSAASTSFLLPIQVEGSDNLSDWRVLAQGEAIGRLVHAGQLVERTRVPLAATRAAFLRITWAGELPVAVSKILAEHEQLSATSPLAPRELALGPITLKDGAYRVDLGGTLALESITPHLPSDDVLLTATLLLGEGGDAALRQVFTGQIYRLSHAAAALDSGPIALSAARARVLSLRIDSRSEPPKEPLTFSVAYAPDQLLFVPHGTGEHLLAFGSHRAEPAPFAAAPLLAFLSPEQRARLPLESARVGALRTLAGEAARKPPKAPFPMRTALLWSVLVAGAATLILLALRLLKRTQGT
jgi:Protein of unknown function (DUF3999)